MKRINNWLAGRSLTASALCVAAGESMAHGGHPVPAGVPTQHHWHLFDQIVVSSSGLMAAGLAVLALVVFAINKQRRHSRG